MIILDFFEISGKGANMIILDFSEISGKGVNMIILDFSEISGKGSNMIILDFSKISGKRVNKETELQQETMMPEKQEYEKFRQTLLDAIRHDLIGPGKNDQPGKQEEELEASPLQAYGAGILYPQNLQQNSHDDPRVLRGCRTRLLVVRQPEKM